VPSCSFSCYKNGKGCTVSDDGVCPYVFATQGQTPTYNLKDWQKELIKSMSNGKPKQRN